MSVNQSAKRGTVTDEHKQEAAALKAIWNRTKAARAAAGVGSQEAFGDKFDIGNQAAVGFFLNGHTALSMKAALGFARGLGCAVADFSPRLAKMLPSLPDEDKATPWPFKRLSPDEWEHIDEFDRAVAENAYLDALERSRARVLNAAPVASSRKPRTVGA